MPQCTFTRHNAEELSEVAAPTLFMIVALGLAGSSAKLKTGLGTGIGWGRSLRDVTGARLVRPWFTWVGSHRFATVSFMDQTRGLGATSL